MKWQSVKKMKNFEKLYSLYDVIRVIKNEKYKRMDYHELRLNEKPNGVMNTQVKSTKLYHQ